MKLHIISYLVFGLIFTPEVGLLAQPNIGIYVGLNNSSLSGDSPTDAIYTPRLGYLTGLNIDFKINDEILLSFQPGYGTAGAKLALKDNTGEKYIDSIDITLNYLILPVMINIISNNQRFYFNSGIEIGLLTKASAYNGAETVDLQLEVNEINVTANFGLTYLIPIGKPFLFLDLRYSQGLINISNSGNNSSFVPRIKTSGLKFRTGIQIPL